MQLLTMPMPLSSEVIDDRVATVLDAGANITLNYDDAANVLTISAASGGGAPINAEYITSTTDAALSAERVLTDTATVTWDRSVPGQIKATAGGVGGYTNEDAQDAIGTILQDSATVDFIYNDATPYITGVVKDNSITESMLSLSDNTTKDATTSAHGLLMKLSGNTVHFLRGDGTWITPPGYTDEQIQDLMSTTIVDSPHINWTYQDTLNQLSCDIFGSSIGTSELTNDSVTYAKIQNVTDNRLLGRSAGSSGDVQEITTGTGITLSGGVLSASASGGAPVDAEYVTSTVNGTLTSERVLTDTASVTWDRTVAGQIKAIALGGASAVPFKGCLLKRTSTVTGLNASTGHLVLWGNEDYDTDSFHSTVTNTGRITIPSGITYVQVSAGMHITNVGGTSGFSVQIRKNGTIIVAASGGGAIGYIDPAASFTSSVLAVTAGDYFEVILYCSDTSVDISADADNYFSCAVLEPYSIGGGSYTNEEAQDAVGTILVDSARIDLTYNDATPSITADIIDSSVTYAKIQNVTNGHLLGNGSGVNPAVVRGISVGAGLSLGSDVLSCSISSGAPVDAEYIVSSGRLALTAERVLTNTATVTWDFATAAQAKANVVPDTSRGIHFLFMGA